MHMQTRSGGNPRRRRDAVTGTIKLLEQRMATLEVKEELTEEEVQSVLRMSKLLTDASNDFKAYHFAIIDQIENDDEAAVEQKALDDHDLKVMSLIDRLAELLKKGKSSATEQVAPQPTASYTTPPPLDTRLMDRQLESMEESVGELKRAVNASGEETYALTTYLDKTKSLEGELRVLKEKILSLDDYEDRKDRASHIERDFLQLRLDISRKLTPMKKEPVPDTIGTPMMAGVNLPRIEVPKFDGNILNWRPFWEQFRAAVHDKTYLGNIDKLTYLQDAIKGGPAMYVIRGLTQTAESYDEAVKCLHERYNRPRFTHHEHVRSFLQAPAMKASNGKELRKLHDTCKQHLRAIQLADQFDLESFLTIAMELKLDEKTRLEWMKHSNDSMKTPPYTDLLKFLDVQAQHFESAMSERKSQTTSQRSFAATFDREEACVACKKGNHPLAACTKFQGLPQEERWDIIKKASLCKNCLKPGHVASNCFKPPLCKKCNRYHHTLLHMDGDFKAKGDKTVEATKVATKESEEATGKEKCHLAAASRCEQVLLMTCKLKVISEDGSSTIARALIDPGSSASYVTERLAQLLRMPRTRRNALVDGIADSTTRTRGSVHFQVSGMNDDSEKVRVQAYVLKNICKSLPLHPILPSLKWEHISDLELADPEFRFPSRVDILLGAEVFVEILRDGRRKGPPGTPSALNTCFGWVVFGKVFGSDRDVVEEANLTMERQVYIEEKDIVDTRHCFMSMVTTDKDYDFRRRRRKKRRVVQRQPHARECYEDHRTRREGFDRSRISRSTRKVGPTPRKRWGNRWVSAGGMLAPECTMSTFTIRP